MEIEISLLRYYKTPLFRTYPTLNNCIECISLILLKVIRNLVSNALKFTPAGGKVIVNMLTKYKFKRHHLPYNYHFNADKDGHRNEVGPWEEDDHAHDNIFRIEVIDTGPGISLVMS